LRASREVAWLLRVFRREPYRLSGSPNPPRRFGVATVAPEVFRLAPSPASLHMRVHPLSSFGPPTETPHRCWPYGLPLMGFSAPAASSSTVSRHVAPAPAETPSPCGLSQTLGGLILTEPCGLVSSHIRSWGSSTLQGLSPTYNPSRLVTCRIPSRRLLTIRFPRTPKRSLRLLVPRPQGVASHAGP